MAARIQGMQSKMRSAAKTSTIKRFLVDGIQAVQTRLNRRGRRATKDWDKSADRWRRALDRLGDGAPVTAYLSLSRAQRKQGNLEAAESTIARARELHPTNVDLEVQFSELAMAKKAWRLAVTRWRALLDSLGGAAPPKAFARLSDAYRNLGLLQDADATLEEGLKLHPNDINLMISYAENSMAQQDWAIAAQRWTALLAADEVGVPPLVFSRLTKAYRGLGDFAAADKTAMDGLHLHPDNLQIAIARAEVATTQADWSEAIKRWGALLNRPDVKPQIFSALSAAYRNSGKFELAHATIERGLNQFPGNQALAVEHADIATTQKNWPEAIKRWRKVLETYGDSEYAHMKLLVALASAGDNEAAQIAFSHFQSASVDNNYDQWIKTRDNLDDNDRRLIREHADSFSVKPKFSILMPVYNTSTDHLRCAIKSIVDQLYSNWELCIVDDASTKAGIREIIDEASKDSRIRPVYRKKNGGIAVCTNTALKISSGDWMVLMDHDDALSEHALYLIAEAINRDKELSIVYSDEDTIDAAGHSLFPIFKPDWDYDLFLGQNFINHLTAYRADLVRKVGGFREGLDGSQDWDLALRVLECSAKVKIQHVPFILYHWRMIGESFSNSSLERAAAAAQSAVREHLVRTNQRATVEPQGHSSHLRVTRLLPTPHPLASIIIPTKDHAEQLRNCVEGLLNRTSYKPIEIVLVDNGSTEKDASSLLAELRQHANVKVLDAPGPFNFSKLVNSGVAASSGTICLLLNNDTNVINEDWLEEMVSHALRPEVGAVGAKLFYPNGLLQHGGVLLGLGGVACHVHTLFPPNAPGYFNRLNLTHSPSCVTGACLATRREVYDALGGFNERDLPISFNDVDFCIRVRQAGYKIIWTPHAKLIHYESLSRGKPETKSEKASQAYLRSRWAAVLDNDPAYNPNLSLKKEFQPVGIGEPTRVRKPWLEFAAARSSSTQTSNKRQSRPHLAERPQL